MPSPFPRISTPNPTPPPPADAYIAKVMGTHPQSYPPDSPPGPAPSEVSRQNRAKPKGRTCDETKAGSSAEVCSPSLVSKTHFTNCWLTLQCLLRDGGEGP